MSLLNTINKAKLAFSVLQKGKMVANPEAWKRGQISVNALGAFLYALVKLSGSFGYEIPADNATIDAIAGGVIALANVMFTLAHSDKIGLPSKH